MKIRILKFFLIGLVVIGCLGGGYTLYDILKERGTSFNMHALSGKGGIENWITFKPEQEKFSIAFPHKPESTSRSLPIPRSSETLPYQEYKCALNSRVLSVSYATLPGNWVKWSSGLVLKGALTVLLKEVKGAHLVGKSSNTFKSYPALDYEHNLGNQETAGTLILIDNLLYKVEVTYPAGEKEAVQAELCQFIDSFTPK